MKIISIGDLVTDYYYKNGKLIGVNGGMTSHNIIANLSKFGMKTAVYGVCGNDVQGDISIKSLSDIGVDVKNIKILDSTKTRCFHVSYEEDEKGKLSFKSKKRCPICNNKRWYEESQIDVTEIIGLIEADDVLVFDNLNVKNQKIIDSVDNKKMLDLGQYFELDNYSDEDIIKKINGKFEIINLNERVERYLSKRFKLENLMKLYHLLNPKLIIITRGKKGSDFVFGDTTINKILNSPSKEIDSTGAGDAFFSMFISEYIKINFVLCEKYISDAFIKSTNLTKKVVKKFGARGHINSLYKIKENRSVCSCENFEIKIRKQIKRCNININNLDTRIINAVNSDAYDKIFKINFSNDVNSIFIGTGGSLASAKFASKVINILFGTNTITLLPRDVYYRNNNNIDRVFLFTYSGTTNDIIEGTSLIDNCKKIVITKGEVQKIVAKTNIMKDNIISYRTSSNKGKERGFLSFEGAVAPASLFLKLYYEKSIESDVNEFILSSLNYWKKYFELYFEKNKDLIKEVFIPSSFFNIFTGDFTESAGIDLESKIVESGIFKCIIHEKKNFSHGRFINYEHISEKKNIYFKQKSCSPYEDSLLEYLKNDYTMIIESRYDGILCEYDLLIASQFLVYYISNYLGIDMSKPTYSDESMKIYFYKGKI